MILRFDILPGLKAGEDVNEESVREEQILNAIEVVRAGLQRLDEHETQVKALRNALNNAIQSGERISMSES